MSDRGFDKARIDRLRGTLARHVESGGVPGLVALVGHGAEVRVEALGATSLGGPPVARDTVFRVASLSKPITAAAAMVLVEECRLRLDDPVDELLPELADRQVLRNLDGPLEDTVPARRPITVRDLLTFRLGLGIPMVAPRTYPIQRAMDDLGLGQHVPHPQQVPGPDEWLRRLGTLPLMYQPGERWMYNTGSDILGVLIARAAGRPFEEFLRERLFEPLGMKDTAFSVPADQLHRLATAYGADPATGELTVYDEAVGSEWSTPPAFPSGAGGLVSTADDFHAFGRMLLAGGRFGGRRVLSRASVELMTSDQLTPGEKALSSMGSGFFDENGWGFGGSVVTRRTELGHPVGQFGWTGGLGTCWAVDPERDLVGVLFTQRLMTSPVPPPVFQDFWTTAYQALDD